MKSKPNPDFAPGQPSLSNAPSVPISVYKELAAELQATRAMIESLNHRNQQLAQQNQMIRQEVERVVQASFNLQQVVDFVESPSGGNQTIAELAGADRTAGGRSLGGASKGAAQQLQIPVEGGHLPLRGALFTEEPSRPQRVGKGLKKPKDLGNYGILVTVLIVVLAAFGLGFVAVKQLLPSR
jgi:TolA-binding protein